MLALFHRGGGLATASRTGLRRSGATERLSRLYSKFDAAFRSAMNRARAVSRSTFDANSIPASYHKRLMRAPLASHLHARHHAITSQVRNEPPIRRLRSLHQSVREPQADGVLAPRIPDALPRGSDHLRHRRRAHARGDRRAGAWSTRATTRASAASSPTARSSSYRRSPSSTAWKTRSSRSSSYFRHAAQGLEEKKQILYLLGPVGGGKTSIAERLKQLMEQVPFYALKAASRR